MVDTLTPSLVLILLHCTVGLVAAQLACRKGYDLGIWMIWGAIGGTAALVDALRRPQRWL
jgi:hypothetical protein